MFTTEADAALRNLGLQEIQIQNLASGNAVAFLLSGAVEGTVCAARLLEFGRLQVGIYTIQSVGGGLADFMTFEARAAAAAKALGVKELELMGFEVNNRALISALEMGGFTLTSFIAPEELGGGTLSAMSRIEPVS